MANSCPVCAVRARTKGYGSWPRGPHSSPHPIGGFAKDTSSSTCRLAARPASVALLLTGSVSEPFLITMCSMAAGEASINARTANARSNARFSGFPSPFAACAYNLNTSTLPPLSLQTSLSSSTTAFGSSSELFSLNQTSVVMCSGVVARATEHANVNGSIIAIRIAASGAAEEFIR